MNGHYFNRLLWGILLIAAGILFLLNQTGQINVNLGYIFSTFWPLFIIYFGLKGIIFTRKYDNGWNGSFIWNLLVLFIGLYFLGRNLDLIDISIGQLIPYIIPVALIGYGLSMIFKPRRSQSNWESHWDPTKYKDWKSDEDLTGSAHSTFDSSKVSFDSEEWSSKHGHHSSNSHNASSGDWFGRNQNVENKSSFFGDLYMGHDFWELRPLNISHFIGDTTLDLTKAHIPYGETKINVSAFIGDLKVFVPNDMELEVSVTYSSFLGDCHVFDRKEGGLFHGMQWESPHYQLSEKRIRIIVSMFIGDVKVQRVG